MEMEEEKRCTSVNQTEEKRLLMEEELKYQEGFLSSVEKKLSNKRFVSNAPEKVVEIERKKAKDARPKM